MIIGLYGKIGSGKTTIAKYIRSKYDFDLIDVDELAKEIVEEKEIKEKLRKAFPHCFDGNVLNRAKLRQELAKSASNTELINKIIWPRLKEAIIQKIALYNSDIVIDGAILPLLSISQIDIYIKVTVGNPLINCLRIYSRDKKGWYQTVKILKQQKLKKFAYNFKIKNRKSRATFLKIDQIIEKIVHD
ncbi:dephospho-CoA kinase [Mesoplasma syrphidae]|uniref:Dephospho-CoA kinase n=1 Tax=Mesoplasma syrphidae TaxID=225999 RepID=A0A2K9BYZ3_9MOLU|nr:dephospho-CoA kinase [Mesoplasma syrphidae]AUF83588.1 dephospho-CoA kinase [Mesoplasma syrphidae]